jgi:hypothetical protein
MMSCGKGSCDQDLDPNPSPNRNPNPNCNLSHPNTNPNPNRNDGRWQRILRSRFRRRISDEISEVNNNIIHLHDYKYIIISL